MRNKEYIFIKYNEGGYRDKYSSEWNLLLDDEPTETVIKKFIIKEKISNGWGYTNDNNLYVKVESNININDYKYVKADEKIYNMWKASKTDNEIACTLLEGIYKENKRRKARKKINKKKVNITTF